MRKELGTHTVDSKTRALQSRSRNLAPRHGHGSVTDPPRANGTFKIEEFGIALEHSANGSSFELDNEDVSLGTLVWLGLIGPALDALEHGRVLLADELDASLHPILVERLIRLFQNAATNPNRAQLISNAHDLNLVDSTGDKRLVAMGQR